MQKQSMGLVTLTTNSFEVLCSEIPVLCSQMIKPSNTKVLAEAINLIRGLTAKVHDNRTRLNAANKAVEASDARVQKLEREINEMRLKSAATAFGTVEEKVVSPLVYTNPFV
jgi:hypothetical protein